ncbi:MAG: ATP-binding protein, partial [Planctomycetota bacterium]
TTAIDLARRLTRATREHRLHREIKNLVRPSVLIIDEVGYLTLDSTQASLLFQVIAERYEKQQAIILTSNKAFAQWAGVFAADAVMASAALDRLLHRATVINIRGESYRMKARHRAGERVEVAEVDGGGGGGAEANLAPPGQPKRPRAQLVTTEREEVSA